MAASMKNVIGRTSWVVRRQLRLSLHHKWRGVSVAASKVLEADPEAVERTRDAAKAHKQHPGKVQLRKVLVPKRLETAIELLLDRYPVDDLQKKCHELTKLIRSRHPPVSDSDLQSLARQLEKTAKDKDGRDPRNLDFDESQKYVEKIKRQVLSQLRKKIYHWKPITFDEKTSVLYTAARMAQNYSVLTQCFTEICQRDPDFLPRSMYNLGSGAGSAIWAAHGLWKEQLFEFYCVDPSADMSTIARLLLQDVDDQKSMHIRDVYFRQFPPSPFQNNYDLVVSSHTLMEMASQKDRLAAVLDMWRMTNSYLVLVEVGTGAGFKLINEARNLILQLEDPTLEGHVFAPCTHDQACPKLVERNSPCFFQISYGPLDILKMNETKMTDTYSYVVMKKGKRPEGAQWPRIIQEVLIRKKHIHCHLCCPSGHLCHSVVTAKRNGKDVYRFARYSRWGDLLPVQFTATDESSDLNRPADPDAADSIPQAESTGSIPVHPCNSSSSRDDASDRKDETEAVNFSDGDRRE